LIRFFNSVSKPPNATKTSERSHLIRLGRKPRIVRENVASH